MKAGDRYVKHVEWSDEDNCFIGSCPELFYGGCHGENSRDVFDALCSRVDEVVEVYEQEGKSLPKPLSGKDLVNLLQRIAS